MVGYVLDNEGNVADHVMQLVVDIVGVNNG